MARRARGQGAIVGGMLRIGLLVALLGLAAMIVGRSALGQAPQTGYDRGWYVSDFWSGEHPPGFAVTRRDAVVQARRSMDKAAARDVACKLPYLAVIHPWNQRRNARDRITFVSASRIVQLVVKEAFVFEDTGGKAHVRLNKGDTVDYLRNDAEGSVEVRIGGRQYTAGQGLFDHVQDVADDQYVEDDWVALACTGGARAYIFLDDLGLASDDPKVRVAGISGVGPAVTGYGQARDLTEAEARDLEAEREKQGDAPRP